LTKRNWPNHKFSDRKNRAENIILCSTSADKGANNVNFCCSVLSNDLKPVYFIPLGRFQIDFYWLSLTTPLFVTNSPCWAQRKHKIRHLCNWMLFFFKIDNASKRAHFCMKIRTFLQIVRSGKITASPKANLSINKKIVLHKFNICNPRILEQTQCPDWLVNIPFSTSKILKGLNLLKRCKTPTFPPHCYFISYYWGNICV